ncbi:unnamed protein product [Candidula unifasciata]|uniref:G-protein coupled receptors family 1 profile domain-containing protein n=1 Tax=Candidula unifasciata TaxID=100452 RepID=A0A8S3ZNF9_9EUPU|nr:unnamed protein product [Candidula unifasciata]
MTCVAGKMTDDGLIEETRSRELCPFIFQVVAVFLSSFTLVAMSVDRYMAILNPLRPKMSKRVFAVTVAIIWILAFAAPLPTAITSRVVFKEGHTNGLCLEEFEDEYNKYIYR